MSATLNSSPNFRTGDAPTALTWNNDFAIKVDASDGYASGLVVDGGIVSNTSIDNSIVGGKTPALGAFTLLKAIQLDSSFPVGGNLSIDGNGVMQASGSLGVSSITFGTGLSGGTITASGSVAVLYGTTAGTAAQGNDARFATIPTQPSSPPPMDGSASIGVSTAFARADHVHPTDTTRAASANPALTGAARITDASYPRYDLYNSSGGADLKITDIYSSTNQFAIQFVNDAFTAGSGILVATRSGYTVTALDLYAPSITLHGNVSITAGSLIGYQASFGFTPVRQGTGNTVSLWWDGTGLSAQVDSTYLGTLTTYGYVQANMATYNWVNGNFATIGYVNGTFATTSYLNGTFWTASFIAANFKNISAYTPNQNVDTGSTAVFGTMVCQNFVTAQTDPGFWALYHSGNVYVRYQGLFDYGPINYASDARLKRDIAPSETDCLETINRFKVQQFRWNDRDETVPAGLITQQLKEVHRSAVHERPQATEGDAVFYESVNPTIMCALLVGAVQQLSAEIAALKAAIPA